MLRVSGSSELKALDGFNLEIQQESFTLVGRSGEVVKPRLLICFHGLLVQVQVKS